MLLVIVFLLLLFTVCSSALTQEFLPIFTSQSCSDGKTKYKKA